MTSTTTPPAVGLDPTDRALIGLMASGKTCTEASAELGISVTTTYRRQRRPHFRAALTEAKAGLFRPALTAAVAALPHSVETFIGVMDDPAAKNADRISAAKAVVDVALRFAEQIDMQASLAEVQAQLAELPGNAATDFGPFTAECERVEPTDTPDGATTDER